MIIFQTKYQDASYEGDKALFVSEWKSSSEEMDDETYKKEIMGILRDLRKLFQYCSCKKKVRKRTRSCIYYQFG